MEQSTRNKTVYWDPYKKEYVTIDTSEWSGGEVLDFHKDLSYYLNAEGDYVYGIKPKDMYYASDTGDAEDTYYREGVNPNPPNPDYIALQGMGEDGKQAHVNRRTGETNVKPKTSTAPPPAGDAGGSAGDGAGADGGGSGAGGGATSGADSGISGEQLQALLDSMVGIMPTADPAVVYEGAAQNQNTASGYVKPTYGQVEQKSQLGAGDSGGLLDAILRKMKG